MASYRLFVVSLVKSLVLYLNGDGFYSGIFNVLYGEQFKFFSYVIGKTFGILHEYFIVIYINVQNQLLIMEFCIIFLHCLPKVLFEVLPLLPSFIFVTN